MSRQNAREAAVRFLYQCDMTGESVSSAVEGYFQNIQPDDEDVYLPMSDSDIEYMNCLLSGVTDNIEEIDNAISLNSKGWKINRISRTLMAIMRVAIFEMIHLPDVPVKVSLNEAVEMSKWYDGEEAGAFANGVLGGVVKQFGLCE